ncbi:MAG: signal recognition particle protein [Thermoprotei archaeon]|nr:MAG: signal recognition particle protein [Thermoprotei archaeon]
MRFLSELKGAILSFIKGKEPYEVAVENFVKELQKALLRADVNVKLVFSLTRSIKERALKESPPPYVSRREWFIKIVYEELSKLFGGDKTPNIFPPKTPWVILLVGVQGSGKTTSAAKIAYLYKKYGYRPCLATVDTYRPAAYEQLQQLANAIDVPFCGDPNCKNPVDIANKCLEKFRKLGCSIIIIDTAGRHGYGNEQALLEEMKALADSIKPDEVVMVIDAAMGQKAYDLAKRFHDYTPIGSIVVTKLDGSARGGGALSAVAATGATIKFVGTGEKIPEIEVFNPRKFVARLLGLGDLESLIEKLKSLDIGRAVEKRMSHAIASGKFTLRDLYAQIIALRKLGPLRKILQMIPGLSLLPISDDQLKLSEEKLRRWIAIMDSMTMEELDKPSIIDRRRMERIARGSGTSIDEVRELLKYYQMMQRMLKQVRRRRKVRIPGLDFLKLT